jgi:hypothetical protein
VSRSRVLTLVACAGVTTMALAGCAAAPDSPAAAASGRAMGTSSAGADSAPRVTGGGPGQPTTVPSPSPAAAGPQNLVATAAVKASLTAAFAAEKKLPLDQLAGPQRGSLFYGYLPSTQTYWAVSHFSLVPSAPMPAQVGMQDGGGMGVFTRTASQAWTFVGSGFGPTGCPPGVPAGLLSLWGFRLSSGGACP